MQARTPAPLRTPALNRVGNREAEQGVDGLTPEGPGLKSPLADTINGRLVKESIDGPDDPDRADRAVSSDDQEENDDALDPVAAGFRGIGTRDLREGDRWVALAGPDVDPAKTWDSPQNPAGYAPRDPARDAPRHATFDATLDAPDGVPPKSAS